MTESPLQRHRRTLAKRWMEGVMTQHARRVQSSSDRLSDPATELLRVCIDGMLDALEAGPNREELEKAADGFLKLQALQDIRPSQALRFVFDAKPLLLEVLRLDLKDAEWQVFSSRIDDIALVAFDIYVRAREKVCEARYGQLKKLHYALVERACRSLAQDDSSDSPRCDGSPEEQCP